MLRSRFGVWGLWFMVWYLGCRAEPLPRACPVELALVLRLGFGVWGSGCGVLGLECGVVRVWVWSLGFRVYVSGLKVYGFRLQGVWVSRLKVGFRFQGSRCLGFKVEGVKCRDTWKMRLARSRVVVRSVVTAFCVKSHGTCTNRGHTSLFV